MSDGMEFLRDGAIASITLNRSQAGNAIDVSMARGLLETAIACDEDESIRCVLLTGNGKLFCAGGDIAAFHAAGDSLPALLKELTAYLHSAISRLSRMRKPIVVAVNGPAAGAGFSLAMLGDIVLAAPSAHFTLAYTAIGVCPDGGATWILPRLVGLRRAQELILLNPRIKANEAAALGLITRVVEEGKLTEDSLSVAKTLANQATSAFDASRRLLLDSFSNTLETQMELESRSIASLARTANGREGIAAFVQKRAPKFNKE